MQISSKVHTPYRSKAQFTNLQTKFNFFFEVTPLQALSVQQLNVPG